MVEGWQLNFLDLVKCFPVWVLLLVLKLLPVRRQCVYCLLGIVFFFTLKKYLHWCCVYFIYLWLK